jgi:steroid delta-isomerase-like uncharacterized protein
VVTIVVEYDLKEGPKKIHLEQGEITMTDPIEIAKEWLMAMNNRDLVQMNSFCWEDAVADEVADPPPAEGRDAIANSYRELFEGFPDCTSEILNIFSSPDHVLAEVRWHGTNSADFKGIPATNKVVDIRIAYIFQIEKDKIKRITEYYDGAAVADQMGLSEGS